MTDQSSPADPPVLSRVQPLPGGLYGDEPHEAARSDLRRPSLNTRRTARPTSTAHGSNSSSARTTPPP
ncbi:hypothetical protein ACWCPF_32535 [Streptomyces sp. NPDC001858]